MSKLYVSMGSQWLSRILRLQVSAGLLLALNLSANAVETASALCEHATNVDAAIEACSSIIQTDKDRHRLALAYFNRAGWHLKKDDVNRAASDLSEAIRFEPDFAAALTKRGLLEERLNDLRSARADFAAVLKLPTTNSLSVWAHAMARERLAATEAAAKSAATSKPAPAAPDRVAARFLEETARTGTSRMQREAIRSDQASRRKRCNRAQSMLSRARAHVLRGRRTTSGGKLHQTGLCGYRLCRLS